MRLYRASPLHPALGAALARLLGVATAHLPSPQIRVVRGIRWELDLREVIDASLYFSGSFEPRAERAMGRHLGPGMTAIDVGANVGYHTLRMAIEVGPGGRVIAVEPASPVVTRLRRNLSLNELKNVEIVVAALGDHDLEAARLRLQSSYPLSGRGASEAVLVRVARLDSLVLERQLNRVDLIKIDVDGQEAKVLRGARDTLQGASSRLSSSSSLPPWSKRAATRSASSSARFWTSATRSRTREELGGRTPSSRASVCAEERGAISSPCRRGFPDLALDACRRRRGSRPSSSALTAQAGGCDSRTW